MVSYKVGCILPVVVVSILHHVEFGPNDHREDASLFNWRFTVNDHKIEHIILEILIIFVSLHSQIRHIWSNWFQQRLTWLEIYNMLHIRQAIISNILKVIFVVEKRYF